LPVGGDSLYAFRVETKTALILGGGGITGGMYELGALSAGRFLQQAAVPAGRCRFGIVRQKSTAPVRGVSR